MTPILPGATIGVLGSGQLGRMFAIAARRMGYRVEVFSNDRDLMTPAGEVCNQEWKADYSDVTQLTAFARNVQVVTLEFENIDTEAVRVIERTTPVRPGENVLFTAQHRSREKTALRKMGLGTAPFAIVRSLEDLRSAILDPAVGGPSGQGILKTAASGYDGKGQIRVRSTDDLAAAWASLKTDEAVLEGLVNFDCELSIIGVRGLQGEFTAYGPFHNEHRDHILDVTVSPVGFLPKNLCDEAVEIARTVMESLDAFGVLCVEMFYTTDGRLLVNEIAPRPHNSGHLTIDAHVSCQFEQQVRSVCGLPLGSNRQRQPAAMANLLGDVWDAEVGPQWSQMLAMPDVKLHLYGKATPRHGRKMGHLTAVCESAEDAVRQARQARGVLRGKS